MTTIADRTVISVEFQWLMLCSGEFRTPFLPLNISYVWTMVCFPCASVCVRALSNNGWYETINCSNLYNFLVFVVLFVYHLKCSHHIARHQIAILCRVFHFLVSSEYKYIFITRKPKREWGAILMSTVTSEPLPSLRATFSTFVCMEAINKYFMKFHSRICESHWVRVIITFHKCNCTAMNNIRIWSPTTRFYLLWNWL